MFTKEQAALVKGMLERGDKQHHIAAYFGENSGRIIDVKSGKLHADVPAMPVDKLPPPYRAPLAMLIDETMELASQLQTLDELITTTPEGSPSLVMNLCPALIEEVLKTRNTHNRTQRRKKIQQFMRDMLEARWRLSGEPVIFGSNGQLLNGQNRLRAALLADVVLRTYVVFGIDPEAYRVIDSGAGRTGGDTFQVAGVPNHQLVGQAVRWLMIFNAPSYDRGITVSNDDLFEHYRRHVNKDLLAKCVVAARAVRRTLPKGSLVALFYLFTRKDARTASVFIHDLQKELRGGNALLKKVDHLRGQTGMRVKESVFTALTVMAWNGYRAGKPLTVAQLRWTDDEPHPDMK
jgi:hypothetical protein